MHRNADFFETAFIAPGNLAGDLNAGLTGQWKKLGLYGRITAVLVSAAAGRAGGTTTITFEQAQSAAGLNAKALNIKALARCQGADISAAGYTVDTPPTPSSGIAVSTAGNNQIIWQAEVQAGDLDLANGFTHVRASATLTGGTPAAAAAVLLYIMGNPSTYKRPVAEPNTGV